MKIKIKNGLVVTLGVNCKVLYNHDVIFENGVILSVKPSMQDFDEKFDKVIDAKGKIVMPAYINTHQHFYSTMVRGLGKAAPSENFKDVLDNLWWRLDKKLTNEDAFYSTLTVLIEGIKKGCVTYVDHHASPYNIKGSLNAIADAFKVAGTRGVFCYEVSDRDGERIAFEGIDENKDFIESCIGTNDCMTGAMFGLHASFTIGDKTLKRCADIAHKYNSGFHVHVAESVYDQKKTLEKYGKRVVERFNDFGVLGNKTILAHCVHVDDDELALIAKSGSMVSHQPQSNMNNAVGIADIIKMNRMGITVGIGTDAMTVDMPQEARVALWAQHLRHNNPSCGFVEVSEALYINNGEIVGKLFDGKLKTGVLESGFAADIIIADYNAPTPLNDDSVYGHLLYGISSAVVDTTICNGKVLMEGKVLKLNVNEDEVASISRKIASKLWERF